MWARIEALNIDSLERAEVLRIGANSQPRAIAVDPNHRWECPNAQSLFIIFGCVIILCRTMFWTDWGITARIERSSMDGDDRRTVHEVGLSQPNGITIDYTTLKIYWTDSDFDKIEYSNYDGTERVLLESINEGIFHPFGVAVVNELLFWTDWETNHLYYTHKYHGNTSGLGVFESLAHFTSSPHGVEALDDGRQAPGNSN